MALEPTGGRKAFSSPKVIGDAWIDSSFTPKLSALDTKYGSAAVNNFILAACGYVNRYCHRYFNTQQADDVFLDYKLNTFSYLSLALRNAPVSSIDQVWLQVNGTFIEVESTYFQLDSQAGIVKVTPSDTVSGLVAAPTILSDNTNIWVRYTSGFTSEGVPFEVKMATARYAAASIEQDATDSTLDSFSTQTYSEKRSGGGNGGAFGAAIDKVNRDLDSYCRINLA